MIQANSHLALGIIFRFNLQGGLGMSDQEFLAAGANNSTIYIDLMFGSGELDMADGSSKPIMLTGEWAYDV